MTIKTWTTAVAMLALAAAPVTGQQMRMGAPGQGAAKMSPDTMQMCHAMMGEGGGMGGHAMMGEGSGMGGHAMMGGGDMGMMSLMQGVQPTPADVLGAEERLQLTPEQKASMESLANAAAESRQAHMQAAMAARQRAAEALKAEVPDLAAYERDLQEAADHMVQAHVAMTRASLEARAALTPEQRAELQDSMSPMGSMKCGHLGAGGMMGRHPGA